MKSATEIFLEKFLGTTDVPTYLAWFALAFVGALTIILIKKMFNLSKKPVTITQLGVGFLITFIFLRFSFSIVGLQPTDFGALMIGASNNELAHMFLKLKFFQKKTE